MGKYICKYYDKDRNETGNSIEIMGSEKLSVAWDRIKKSAKVDDVYYNIFTPSGNRMSNREMKL